MADRPAVGAPPARPSGDALPKLVYGTAWKKDRTADLVYTALRAGFRAIDTAAQPSHYDEPAVGDGVRRAVAEGLVSREDLFIQTKFTAPGGQNHRAPYDLHAPLEDMVRQSVRSSLHSFTVQDQEPYIDSILLHSPMSTVQDTVTVWKTLESYAPHQVRSLGICNTNLDLVRALYDHMAIKPTFVQNRFDRQGNFDVDIRRFCRESGVVFQSFWTLTANRPMIQNQVVRRVAQMTGVEAVAAYYSLVLGLGNVAVLDGTTREVSMKEDLRGVETVGAWAQGQGAADWEAALESFKAMVGDT